MTTYPARFKSALAAIESIQNQTIRPSALVINISEEDWSAAEKDFNRQAKFKFKGWVIIKPCLNLKPANKIIHTAREYGDKVIITFDDDILYPKNRVEELFNKHLEYPNNPIAYRTRKIGFTGNSVDPYGSWKLSYQQEGPSKLNFPTSVSGSLYPPYFFPEDFFNTEKYRILSHDNDDIWTYFHVLLKGSAFVRGGEEIVPPGVPGSQESALWKKNVSRGGNDAIIARLEKEYGILYNLTK